MKIFRKVKGMLGQVLFFNKPKYVNKKKNGVQELRDYLESEGLIGKKINIKPIGILTSYINHLFRSLIKIRGLKDYKMITNTFFGGLIKMYPDYFDPLKDAVEAADIKMIYTTYINIMIGASFLAAVITAMVIIINSMLLKIPFLWTLAGVIIFPILVLLITFSIFYIHPFHIINKKRRDIETNLPFAINHMSAIASSGVPPKKGFAMLGEYKEYGEVSNECREITQEMDVLGGDIIGAIRKIAAKTPSTAFKEVLYGILSTIEGGGNLKEYLNEMAKFALFNYQLSRKKYLETLSTYADIYTAILIAAPLFLVAVLAVMNIVPGSKIIGISIDSFMWLGVYVFIPVLNGAFIVFVNLTQPEI